MSNSTKNSALLTHTICILHIVWFEDISTTAFIPCYSIHLKVIWHLQRNIPFEMFFYLVFIMCVSVHLGELCGCLYGIILCLLIQIMMIFGDISLMSTCIYAEHLWINLRMTAIYLHKCYNCSKQNT